MHKTEYKVISFFDACCTASQSYGFWIEGYKTKRVVYSCKLQMTSLDLIGEKDVYFKLRDLDTLNSFILIFSFNTPLNLSSMRWLFDKVNDVFFYIISRIFHPVPIFLLIVIVLPSLLIAWAAGVFNDNRKVKILRYDTVVIAFEALQSTGSKALSFVNFYVLPGDDCYYIYEANSLNTLGYSEMKWRRVKELPGYLTGSKDIYVNSVMIGKVRELEYTLVPVQILPDSIRENVKEQLKQEYPMPEHNDFDDRQEHFHHPPLPGLTITPASTGRYINIARLFGRTGQKSIQIEP